jgi:predicted transcriptional regulator
MGRQARDVTETELAIVRVLWEEGPSTIRNLTEALYPGEVDAKYATVNKLLERLEAKGCVNRDRTNNVHVFDAAIERDDLVARWLQNVSETLCDGSLTPLLSHVARVETLTTAQRETLQKLIDELKPPPGPKKKQRRARRS